MKELSRHLMMNKKLVLSIGLVSIGITLSFAVDYNRAPDGTIMESKVVTQGTLSNRLGEIESLLEFNNSRVADMAAQVVVLQAQIDKFQAFIGTHTALIDDLNDEKGKIVEVLK